MALLFFSIALIPGALMSGCAKTGDAERGKITEKPPAAVEVISVSATELMEGVDVIGTLTPKFSAEVKSEIPGLVREVYVTEWVKVRKGTPLARIDVSESEAIVGKAGAGVESARAAHLEAQAAAQRAERERARLRELKEYGLATRQALDEAETEVAAAGARVAAARAQIGVAQEELRRAKTRLAKGILRAPLDGMVSLRDVNVGDLASDTGAAKPLFRIVDNRILNLTVTLPSVEMAAVKVGDPLTFTVDALPGRNFKGKVMYINPEVDEADRSVRVVAEVENSSGELKGGLFAKGRILTGTRKNVLLVPRTALQGLNLAEKKAEVYVAEGDRVRYRAVSTGTVAGEVVEITAGVSPGDSLVVRGGFTLKDGDRIIAYTGKSGGK
ncbi:MAG: efflux RND transporter periplasmic adaptor subunit [Alphaproteobacteria bacterium]|uniref:Efflux RND transporter periplasmic adaptor subunit n=1 Tax=Candidatus Nitrobium versatile TaxID=2884831 RepID=A0A953M3V7_9BACT|nr:efflux RND transporter periplasmic adaptor subunit [Candidatus Nitrobium versatile]